MAQLIYVVGPSGAGKDSLLSYVRSRFEGEAIALIAHRYITRPSSAGGEDHIEVTSSEFDLMKRKGLFALDWASHGLKYGVGREIDLWLESGLHVLVNGSRAYLDEAAHRYPDLRVISLNVSPHVLKDRLLRRGRETLTQIEERVKRATAFTVDHPSTVTLNNDGSLEETGAKFLALLTRSRLSVTAPLGR